MHVHFRRRILQPPVTQHAKATLLVPRGGNRSKRAKKTQTMHCCGECKGKGTANHFKIELNPQVLPGRNVLTRGEETN